MGLNDSYTHLRGNILMMNPAPTVSQAYSFFVQEEKQRGINAESPIVEQSASFNVTNNSKAPYNVNCTKGNTSIKRHDEQRPKVCFHWRAGKCSRFVCPFLHSERTTSDGGGGGAGPTSSKRPHSLVGPAAEGFSKRKSLNFNNTWSRVRGGSTSRGRGVSDAVRKKEKICNNWVQGNCSYGDKCRFLHCWCVGDRLSMLTTLEGHQQVVTGIALPSGSDKLYSGSTDKTVRIWDCQSGQCAEVIKLDGEVGCMFSAGPWVFVGVPNMVRAWNAQSAVDLSISGPLGQVYALVVGEDLLFAGAQDGRIVAWKFYPASNCFEPAASLEGHSHAVVTLAVLVVANRLFSGSMDHTIRVTQFIHITS